MDARRSGPSPRTAGRGCGSRGWRRCRRSRRPRCRAISRRRSRGRSRSQWVSAVAISGRPARPLAIRWCSFWMPWPKRYWKIGATRRPARAAVAASASISASERATGFSTTTSKPASKRLHRLREMQRGRGADVDEVEIAGQHARRNRRRAPGWRTSPAPRRRGRRRCRRARRPRRGRAAPGRPRYARRRCPSRRRRRAAASSRRALGRARRRCAPPWHGRRAPVPSRGSTACWPIAVSVRFSTSSRSRAP